MNIAFGVLMTPDGTDYPWYTGCWGLHARWPDEGFCNLRRTWELLVESGARSWSKQDTISIPAGKIKSHLIFHISVLDFFQFYHMVHVFINMSLESIKMCFFSCKGWQTTTKCRQTGSGCPSIVNGLEYSQGRFMLDK